MVNATEPGSWKPHWQKLISQVQGVIPANCRVIVVAERGLYADWLYQLIKNVGWHPFLRINHQVPYRLPSQQTWQPLADLVRPGGQSWSEEVVCFKTNPLSCTLLARWDLDYKDPWLIWMVSLGGTTETQSLTSNFPKMPPEKIAVHESSGIKKERHLSCFVLGFVTLMADLLNNIPIHLERWSSFPHTRVDSFYACNSS